MLTRKLSLLLLSALLLALSSGFASAQTPFICGADLSSVQQIEDAGGIYRDANGSPVDVVVLLRDQGVNTVRLRLWHAPPDGYNDLAHTLTMAARIKEAGLNFLLDFHYSDTWADPSQQTKPAHWENLPFPALTDAVYRYTSEVLNALNEQDTPPDMVQIGNEITSGLLWEDGHVDGENNWSQLVALLQAGARAVRESAPSAQIMLHIDSGANQPVTEWFFDHISDQVDFDIIGLSYYPWWQGTLAELASNLAFVAERYGKPIILTEVAYPWTLEWSDNMHNPVGESRQLHDGYPATPAGQRDFLLQLTRLLAATPNELGSGFFYWEPAAISAPELESFWENVTQFDFEGHALPSLDVYAQCQT